jgi:hypothetical protein
MYTAQKEQMSAAIHGHTNDGGNALDSQINELHSEIDAIVPTFQDFNQHNSNRDEIFSNFSNNSVDTPENFKNNLLHHLAMTIVVKENKTRYQKEQFDRLILSNNHPSLKMRS